VSRPNGIAFHDDFAVTKEVVIHHVRSRRETFEDQASSLLRKSRLRAAWSIMPHSTLSTAAFRVPTAQLDLL
jgi:hypothetical protein